ncbi:TetR/AcrR family transcriptional regulator [Sanguibacter sp. YZGR15]|uniref:TetR/AcrR family transcriptional regulator n=2 Tax=Sanguibacter suaedae TaxID=2795737 RepID=A0A934I934_9MICO|nr:TetR/AcrR family transcriptional regulator [Sanguibacter suaedae]
MPRLERHAQLLSIAQDLFAAHGFHHISMDDIAERADVSKPILYRHFPSKLDLYLAVVDERGQALVDAVSAALATLEDPDRVEGSADGHAVVHAVVRAYVDFAEGSGVAASLLFESDVTRDTAVRSRVEGPDRRNAEAFARVLGRLTDLTPSQALTVAWTATAMARVAATDALLKQQLDEPWECSPTSEETVDLVAQFAWRGIHGMLRRGGAAEDPSSA